MRPWLVLLTAAALMLLNIAVGGVLPYLLLRSLFGPRSPITTITSDAGVAVAAGVTAWLWWRRSGQAPGRGVFARSGLRPLRRAPGQFALGSGLAALVVGLVAGLDRLLGIGYLALPDLHRAGTDGGPAAAVIVILGSAWVVQGFPEELLWRGQAARELSRTWSPLAVIVATSLTFGAMHIISNSGATTWWERGLYVCQAIAFGFLLVACRVAGHGLWLGIGYHGGYDLLNSRILHVTHAFSISLALGIAVQVTVGLLLLRHSHDPWTVPIAQDGVAAQGVADSQMVAQGE